MMLNSSPSQYFYAAHVCFQFLDYHVQQNDVLFTHYCFTFFLCAIHADEDLPTAALFYFALQDLNVVVAAFFFTKSY